MTPRVPDLPKRMSHLPLDHRGFPVPWFVGRNTEGDLDARYADPDKWQLAVRQGRCWICGEQLGTFKVFVLGPMCCITRTTSEPPCHAECASIAARYCPFMANPMAKRNERNEPDNLNAPPGIAINRNPGVVCLWVTKKFEVFDDGNGRQLIQVGDPLTFEFYAEGREARPNEIIRSIVTGIPLLRAQADRDGPAGHKALDSVIAQFKQRIFDFGAEEQVLLG